jgi:hypothetical protein
MDGKSLTVADLIVALQKIEDQTLFVQAEGCDCVNPVSGVDAPDLTGNVLITVTL